MDGFVSWVSSCVLNVVRNSVVIIGVLINLLAIACMAT